MSSAAARHSEETFKRRLGGRNRFRVSKLVDSVGGTVGWAKPIVFVSGFWRSGTTWLQEDVAHRLHAKTVFEPLARQNPAWERHLLGAGVKDRVLQEAFVPGSTDQASPMWPYLDHTFSGRLPNVVSLTARSSLRESRRRAIVVKDVRLQANLRTVHARYGIPVVHIRRHPCAVVASLRAAGWDWSFDDVRLSDLLKPLRRDLDTAGDLSEVVGSPAFDTDAIARIAAFWAITERLAEQALETDPWSVRVLYEQAVVSPETVLGLICTALNLRPKVSTGRTLDSVTTGPESRGSDPSLRLWRWRSQIALTDIGRINSIVNTILPGFIERSWPGTSGC